MQKAAVQRTFSFPIASGATSDSPSEVAIAPDYNTKKWKIYLDYTSFFQDLRKDNPINFFNLLNHICYFFKADQFVAFQTIPQLKLPGLEWTSVVDVPDRIVSIGQILASSRDPQKILDISTFFAGRTQTTGEKAPSIIYPEVILLYAPKIPFPIKITAPTSLYIKAPAFISMIPGNAVHELAKIIAPEFSLEDIIKAFSKIYGLFPEKVFLLKELIVKMPSEPNPVSLTNVIIFNNIYINDPNISTKDHLNGCYYTYNNNYYFIGWDKQTKPSDDELRYRFSVDNYLDRILTSIANITSDQTVKPTIVQKNLKELKSFMEGRGQEKEKPKFLQESILQHDLLNFFSDLFALGKTIS